MKQTKAARSRRVDPLPGAALNLEILGVALLALAILLALALALPARSGWLGPLAAHALRGGFGGAAWLAVTLLAAVAVIVFLELHAVRRLVVVASCALGEFLVLTAWLGMAQHGGIVGNALARAGVWLVGPAGARVVLAFGALACLVIPTRLSLKKTVALCVAALASVTGRLASALRRVRPPSTSAVTPAPPGAALAQSAERENRLDTTSDTDVPVPPPTPAGEAVVEISPAPAQQTIVDATAVTDAAASSGGHAVSAEQSPTPVGTVMPPGERSGGACETAGHDLMAVRIERRQPLRRVPAVSGEPAGGSGHYRLPDLAIFNPPEKRVVDEASAALLLEETLASFGISGRVTHIERGPSVTRYEITPGKGVKVSAIRSLADNIQLALAAQSIRIEAPIPGKSAVGIEVPNSAVATVGVREILDYLPRGGSTLSFALGKDITGRPIVADLTRMPHLLVAGATGAGKSVCLNVILTSLLVTHTPDELQVMLIDPKRVELTTYNGIPHLIRECITDPKLAAGALYELTKEMDARYELFARAGVRKIEEYNHARTADRLPYVVVVIDELADLMLVAPTRVETSICRIAQLARATGIHLVVATQRPSVDVITGLIKANIPSRIAFAVSSQVDSRTIIDMAGAERLLGRGDMLFLPIDAPKPIRVQGALVTSDEMERLCEFWRGQDDPANRLQMTLSEVEEDARGPSDDLAYEAAKVIVERQMASVALLQAELKVGHPRAVRLMKILEEYRVVGPAEGTKPRKILIGSAELDQVAALLAPRESQPPLLS